jgi:hypothetical protein
MINESRAGGQGALKDKLKIYAEEAFPNLWWSLARKKLGDDVFLRKKTEKWVSCLQFHTPSITSPFHYRSGKAYLHCFPF